MADQEISELGRAVQDVAERAQVLVREEIALAKAEMTAKVTGLIKGAVVGIVAGVFAVFGLIYLLHAVALALWKLIDDGGTSYFVGYLIVAALLFIFGLIAGLLAARFIKRGTPPTPQMAIEEAQLIRRTLTAPHPATPEGPAGAVQAPEQVSPQ